MPVSEAAWKKYQFYWDHFGNFCHDCLFIKDQNSELVPLILKPVQVKVAEHLCRCVAHDLPIRLIILKARREGMSTVVAAFFFWLTSMNNNMNCYMLSHDEIGASYIYDMHQIFYDEMDADFRPMRRKNNSKILKFENPNDKERHICPGRRSEIRVGSAKSEKIGSGYMTTLLHASEIAKWPKAENTMSSIKQSVPKPPKFSAVILESTAFGTGNYFHKEWKKAIAGGTQSDFTALFFAWFEDLENVEEIPLREDGTKDFTLSEFEKQHKRQFELTDEQMAWRRTTLKDSCDGDEELFKQEYPATAEEAFLVTGRGVFLKSSLKYHESRAPKTPLWRGSFDIQYIQHRDNVQEKIFTEKDPRGSLCIYEAPDFSNDRHYVMGVDVSEGIDVVKDKRSRGDRSAIHIFCQETGKMVAKWADWAEPDVLAKYCFYLGKVYHKALIGIECNNHGLTTLTVLRDLGYPIHQIYHREIYDEDDSEETKKIGWYTSIRTKPLLINNLVSMIRDKEIWGLDLDTLSEFGTYTKNAKGQMGGESGCYDDQVISAGIGAMLLTLLRDDLIKKPAKLTGLKKFNTSKIEMGSFALTGS